MIEVFITFFFIIPMALGFMVGVVLGEKTDHRLQHIFYDWLEINVFKTKGTPPQ